MKPPADKFVVFVVCDDPSHVKAQAITNFVLASDGERRPGYHWDEIYPGRRKDGGDSAVTLVDNAKPDQALAREDEDYWQRARPVYEPECRKCGKPFQWRAERLYAVLDQLYDEYRRAHGAVGVLPVSLREIAATLESLP